MTYWQMVKELSLLEIDTYNFKDFVKFRHRRSGIETEVSRQEMPRKQATPKQCRMVFEVVRKRLGGG